jgi:hypothetical protein
VWFDKVNGNSYHTARVFIDGQVAGDTPVAYGYEQAYTQGRTFECIYNGTVKIPVISED